jgi:hypothetical protein
MLQNLIINFGWPILTKIIQLLSTAFIDNVVVFIGSSFLFKTIYLAVWKYFDEES